MIHVQLAAEEYFLRPKKKLFSQFFDPIEPIATNIIAVVRQHFIPEELIFFIQQYKNSEP